MSIDIHSQIKSAVDVCQRAQRNYDREKVVVEQDLQTMIYAASNSPTKQNETHYALKIYTNKKIYQIYKTTKHFTLYHPDDFHEVFQDNEDSLQVKQENNVYNSQVLSNVLFVYFLDSGNLRGGHHKVTENANASKHSISRLMEQQCYSIGISVGELILSATLMGYKTGICSAFDVDQVKSICQTDLTPKLLVGVGYENKNIDRKLSAETLNKDVPLKYRNGADNQRWMFPSFDKHMSVTINDS